MLAGIIYGLLMVPMMVPSEVGGFGIRHIAAICGAADNLFLDVYTLEYGNELYSGKVNDAGKFSISKITTEDAVKTSLSFDAVLYPNPVVSNATLQITGNTKNVTVSIPDIKGKKLWQGNVGNTKHIKLPTEKYAAGIYLILITNGREGKTLKLVKQ